MAINMKSYTQSANSNRHKKLVEVILLTLLGVLMYVSQVIMAALPNIEIVTLLIILTTRKFGYKAFVSVYIFVGCEVLTYGLSMWVINYLYVWAILWVLILIIRKIDDGIVYALIAAVYGLSFGTLCSFPYFITGGIAGGIAYIIQGFVFDLLHCAGNFVLVLLLYKPLTRVMNKIIK